MVNSDMIVEVVFDDKFTFMGKNGKLDNATMSYTPFGPGMETFLDIQVEYVNGLSTGESGFTGKTLFPDKDGSQNSPNGNIIVVVHKNLSPLGAAEMYSHEANGHALLYILNGGDHDGASHHFEGSTDTNMILREMILESRKETISNMQ